MNGAYPRMHVVGAARSGTEAVYMLRCWRPEVMVVSDRLAGECAIDSLLRFLGSWPAAILRLLGAIESLRASALVQ